MDKPLSVATIDPSPDVAQLSELYEFRGPEVALILPDESSDMLALLRETAAEIVAWFGQGTETVLEYAYDPDDDDDPGQFYALVRTPLEPEEVRDMFDGFREHWVISAWQRSKGRLNVGLEYR